LFELPNISHILNFGDWLTSILTFSCFCIFSIAAPFVHIVINVVYKLTKAAVGNSAAVLYPEK
jgi:hypothetical protein